MPTHVALLRGINVGGRSTVPMAQLRAVVESLGHTEVATYIQSGNVVLTPADADVGTATIAAELERAVGARFEARPAVVVLTAEELRQVAAANPYPDEPDPRKVHAVFRQDDVGAPEHDALAAALERARVKGSPDEAAYVGRTLYLHTPDGLGRSVLAAELGRAGKAMTSAYRGTARNWATVSRLLDMLRG